MEAGAADKAAEAQSRALELNPNDVDLWVERGLSYAAMLAWPRTISDLDHALTLRPNNIEILVLRAAAWRNAGNPVRALDITGHSGRARPFRSAARAWLRPSGALRPTVPRRFRRVLRSCRRAQRWRPKPANAASSRSLSVLSRRGCAQAAETVACRVMM
jgi:tetratricopeptide (TPR) repeat protein